MIRKIISRNPLQANQLAHISVQQKSDSKVVPTQQKVQQQKQSVGSLKAHVPEYKTPDFSKFANLEYKKYPNHLTHFDKSHKDYIPSERDDLMAETVTNEHNYWIDQIKRDLVTQKKVHEILQKMDRPYKRGLPGNTKNISSGIVDHFKPHNVPEGQSPETKASEFLEHNFRNENRWSDQNVYHPKFAKMTHYDVTYQKELDSRPVKRDIHPDKGYKYDIETPYEQRYDYLADRLGHPEILGNPWERLMRLESEMYHPAYLDQPHVKMPGSSPHPSLNFEPGEVIYENTRLLEWAKFWKASGLFGLAWGALFVPYQLLFKTHMPLEMAFDNLFNPYYQRTMFFWDNNQLHIPVTAMTVAYTLYIATSYAHRISKDYVVRMQYSKDKELLFVTTSSPYGSTQEQVYEAHHVEFLPPSVQSGVQHMSLQDKNGLVDATCMSTHQSLVFYQDNKYWNPAVKDEFFANSLNLWTKDYTGYNRLEERQRILSEQINLGDQNQAKLEAKN